MGKAKALKRRARLHRGVRLAIQLVFFIVAPGFFAAAFNGVKHLCQQMGTGSPIEVAGFVALLIGIVVATIAIGRFFCGYACAFGTLGDVLYGVFEAIRVHTPIPRLIFSERLVKVLSLLKFAVLAAICALCFFGVWSAVSGLSPWVSFAALTAGSVEGIALGSFVALGLVVILMIVRERAFCQFLCPLGALFALLPVFGCSTFTRCKDDCIPRCGRCRASCPVSIWPDEGLRQGECISCGRCADACPIGNIDLIAHPPSGTTHACAGQAADEPETVTPSKSGRPARGAERAREGWFLLRGTEVPVVVVKAVALLILFWVLGATRYLPPFAEVLAGLGWGS